MPGSVLSLIISARSSCMICHFMPCKATLPAHVLFDSISIAHLCEDMDVQPLLQAPLTPNPCEPAVGADLSCAPPIYRPKTNPTTYRDLKVKARFKCT